MKGEKSGYILVILLWLICTAVRHTCLLIP